MDLKFIHFQFPGLFSVHCLFQGRSHEMDDEYAGNFSFQTGDDPQNVRRVREKLLQLLENQGLKNWTECRQTHGDNILFEPKPTDTFARPEELREADGMATSTPGQGLVIKTADCQPLLLASGDGRFVMALHVGWRGNRHNFPQKAVRSFCARYALCPSGLFAVRGPSLGPARARFSDFAKEWGPDFLPWHDAKTGCMNLWKLTAWQLRQAGLLPERIYGLDICTQANAQDYFSYRARRDTGRQAAVIWLAG